MVLVCISLGVYLDHNMESILLSLITPTHLILYFEDKGLNKAPTNTKGENIPSKGMVHADKIT